MFYVTALVRKWKHRLFYRRTHSSGFVINCCTFVDSHPNTFSCAFQHSAIKGLPVCAYSNVVQLKRIVYVHILSTRYSCTLFLNTQKHSWLYNVSVASSDAFKKKYAWWGVLELLRRVIILLFLVALPRMEVNYSVLNEISYPYLDN